MTSETGFTENVLKAFKSIIKEIEKGSSSEQDVRYRFVKYFVEEVLGYETKYIRWERKRADLTIIDENDFAVIKIETKRPTENIDKTQHEEQAFKYEEETTRFIGLTNFMQFKLWEVKKTGSELRVNLDFAKILEQRKAIENLSTEEKSQILFLNNLTKENLFDPSKYEKFDETYARIDITKDAGFRKLLDRLNFIANNLLLGYTLRAFGEYKEGYSKYLTELSKIEIESKNNKGNHELNHSIAKYRQKLEEKYKKYITFSGFELWKQYSGKENVPDDEVKEIFCKETIYVLLNKLIFIRICEDKGFLEKNISNGGIEELRAFLKKRFDNDVINKEILEMAFKSASGLYSHFYEVGILDWFRTGDGELNELLNRVLWILNQFDFTHVDRDILGNLYEKYLPSNERKRLGEFYTPTEVIDYILTSVGYTYSYDIETKDLLDPACGSGGFLVRASRRLISRYLMKFGKTDKKELRDPKNWKEIVGRLSPDEAKIILEAIQEHIYGFDINPFACHIAEMNMLFQVIDLYQKVRERYPDYKLKRFKIYRTDSLEKPTQKQLFDWTHKTFLEEQEEIDTIKNMKFDFVVGNPPYVRVHHMAEKDKSYMRENYITPKGDFDIYVCFIERGIEWLKKNCSLGFINSNKYLIREYGEFLRIFLLNNTEIQQIVDVSNCQIFKSAAIYPVINIFKRKTEQLIREKTIRNRFEKNIEIFFIKKGGLELLRNTPAYLKNNPNVMYYTINQMNFYESPNYSMDIHITPDKQKIIDKLDKTGKKLGDLSENFCGTPRSKDYYAWGEQLTDKKPVGEYCKYLVSANVSPYSISWGIPIRSIGKHLRTPYLKYNNKLFTKDKWEIFKSNNKLIVRANDTRLTVALDDEGFAGVGLYFIINIKAEPKYILAILNSKLMNFYYLSKFATAHVSGGYISINGVHLNKLPIKLPETPEEKKIAEQIIKKVNEILELHKSGVVDIDAVLESEETEKLYNLPKVTFNISDNAKFEKIKADDSKIFINSQDFIEIKDKKIKDFVEIYLNTSSEKLAKAKDVKNSILNISVPKSDEVLKSIIEKGKVDQSQIKERIKKLEYEINELVYQIYGITKEERKIVEENL
jgi:type I restriction-modification system DNA methylase subunit